MSDRGPYRTPSFVPREAPPPLGPRERVFDSGDVLPTAVGLLAVCVALAAASCGATRFSPLAGIVIAPTDAIPHLDALEGVLADRTRLQYGRWPTKLPGGS